MNKPIAAPTRLAHIPLGDLDRVEREIGVPVSRAVRRARLEVVA